MKKRSSHKLLLLLAGIAVCTLVNAQKVATSDNLSNVAELSAEGSVDVQQDMIRITLSTTKQGSDAQEVQNQLKHAIDSALQIAKNQTSSTEINIQTGQFSLYPSRNSNNRITGWQGSADMTLSGTDIPRISAVVGRIQSLTISDVAFDISPELRSKTETQAQSKAITAFRKKAKEIAHDFGFRSYALRQISVQSDAYGGPAPRMRMAALKVSDSEAVPLPTEPGKSTVRAIVNGSVQMQ